MGSDCKGPKYQGTDSGGLELGTDTVSLVLVPPAPFSGQTGGERSQSGECPLGPGGRGHPVCAFSDPREGWAPLRASVKWVACTDSRRKEGSEGRS